MSEADSAPDRQELLERIRDLEERVAQLEREDAAEADWRDHYDDHVLDALKPGETVDAGRLQELYRTAGIRQQSTLRDRVKLLVTEGPFIDIDAGTWAYAEGDDE